QLLQPAGDEVEAVGVTVAEIARGEPSSSAQRRGGGRGCLVIADHHVRSAKLDYAAHAGAYRRTAAVADARFVAERPARGTVLALRLVERVRERDRRRLGQSHRLDHREAETRFEGAMLLGRQRRRRRAAEADAA